MAIAQVQYYFQYKEACRRLPICDEGCVCPLYKLAMMKTVKLVSDRNEYLVPKEIAAGFHIYPVTITDELKVIPV